MGQVHYSLLLLFERIIIVRTHYVTFMVLRALLVKAKWMVRQLYQLQSPSLDETHIGESSNVFC